MKKKKAELVKMLLSKENEVAMMRDHNAQLLGMLENYREALNVSDIKIEQLRGGISTWRTTWVITVFVSVVLLIAKCAV